MEREFPELYKCPKCGKNCAIYSIVPLFDDVRYDNVVCECGTQTRVYYKVADMHREVIYMPQDEEGPAREQVPEQETMDIEG